MSETTTYMENIRKLQSSVKTLSEMPEPDVDLILPIVEVGTAAYREVRSRTQLVREGLAKAREVLEG